MIKKTEDKNYKLLLKLLLSERKKAGITQSVLASKLKKNQSYVSKYENGERRIDMIELMYILQVLKVDISDIVSELVKKWKD